MQRTMYRPRSFNKREPAVVEDLRVKLNRIKQEKALSGEGTKNPPPPDPAYNFLKDPLRGDGTNTSSEKKQRNKDQSVKYEAKYENKSNSGDQKNPSKAVENCPQGNHNFTSDKSRRGPPRGWQGQSWKNHAPRDGQQPRQWKDKAVPHHSAKQQPVNNIKIELSSESGERKCTLDETAMVQIPMTVKGNYTGKPRSGKWSQKSTQQYYSCKNKQKLLSKDDEKNEEDTEKQLKACENENQSVIPDERSEKAETVANNDEIQRVTVNKSRETSEIMVNKQKLPVKNDEKKEGTEKQLKANVVNKNENQSVIPDERSEKTETVANNGETEHVIVNNSRETSEIMVNNQKLPGKNDEKKEEGTEKQLKANTVNETENQSATPNEKSGKTETVANNDETGLVTVNKTEETSEITESSNKIGPINEGKQKLETETIEKNDNQSTMPEIGDASQK